MQKNELRKLRALPATKQIMRYGAMYTEEKRHSYLTNKKEIKIIPEYNLLLRAQNLQGFIKIAIFLPEDIRKNIRTPRYEVFLNVQGEEYITRELDENGKEVKWSKAMVMNLPEVYVGYYGTKIYTNKDTLNTLNSLKLAKENGVKGFYRLQRWQQDRKDEETVRKEKREQKPWDDDMALVPALPKSFKEWMRRTCADQFYIFYEYKKGGQTTGYCSKCQKYVKIKNPKLDKKTVCPACHAKSIFKPSGRIKTLADVSHWGEIIQKIDGGIVIRSFIMRQVYVTKPYTNPDIYLKEEYRTLIFENGRTKRYTYDKYKQKYMRWIPDYESWRYSFGYYGEDIFLYRRNLPILKKNSILKYSAFDLWDKLPDNLSRYLEEERKNPIIEKLAKIGMFNLAKDFFHNKIRINKNATELHKMLGLDKSRLQRLKKMDGNKYSLDWIQYEKLANTIWPDDMIKDFGEAEFATSTFGFLEIPISYVKCWNYLKKQMKLMNESMWQTYRTWYDYIGMAQRMKMNTKLEQIAKPKDLKEAHNELVMALQNNEMEKQAKEIEKKWKKVNKVLPKLKKYEFKKGKYQIVAPKSILDIVKEGTVLKHCVHTCDYYFSRIQTDESYLFFLRHAEHPDVPWYTLEVEPSGNIRQKRTTGDNQNKDFDDAINFLKKWQQYFQKQLTEEEKKLGEKANKLRMENYSDLRIKGNRVWHGKLAGQLLADVLEADFMDVTAAG